MRKSPINHIGKKRKARIAGGGSEAALFFDLIGKRRLTDLTRKPITAETAKSYQFAHILPKGMYPELRLNPNNIIIVDDIDQHHFVDAIVAGFKYEFYKMVLNGTAIEAIRDAYNKIKYGNNHKMKNPIKKEL